MSAQQIFRLRNPALLMALAAAFPVISYAAGAANVDFAAGSVTAVNSVGVQRPLSKGAEIGNGDTIRTGDGGRHRCQRLAAGVSGTAPGDPRRKAGATFEMTGKRGIYDRREGAIPASD